MIPTLALPRSRLGSVSIDGRGSAFSPTMGLSARTLESPVKEYIERFSLVTPTGSDFAIRERSIQFLPYFADLKTMQATLERDIVPEVVLYDSEVGTALLATVEKIDIVTQAVIDTKRLVITIHSSRTEQLYFPKAFMEDALAVESFTSKLLQAAIYNYFSLFESAMAGAKHTFKTIGRVPLEVPIAERSLHSFLIQSHISTEERKIELLCSPMKAPIEQVVGCKVDHFEVGAGAGIPITIVQKTDAEREREAAQEEAWNEVFNLIRPYFPDAFSIGINMHFLQGKKIIVLPT